MNLPSAPLALVTGSVHPRTPPPFPLTLLSLSVCLEREEACGEFWIFSSLISLPQQIRPRPLLPWARSIAWPASARTEEESITLTMPCGRVASPDRDRGWFQGCLCSRSHSLRVQALLKPRLWKGLLCCWNTCADFGGALQALSPCEGAPAGYSRSLGESHTRACRGSG